MLLFNVSHSLRPQKLSGTPDPQLIRIFAYLNSNPKSIIFWDQGIQNRFTQRQLGTGVNLRPLHNLMGNGRLEVYGLKRLHLMSHPREEIAVNLIMIEKIVVGTEVTNFDISTGDA